MTAVDMCCAGELMATHTCLITSSSPDSEMCTPVIRRVACRSHLGTPNSWQKASMESERACTCVHANSGTASKGHFNLHWQLASVLNTCSVCSSDSVLRWVL